MDDDTCIRRCLLACVLGLFSVARLVAQTPDFSQPHAGGIYALAISPNGDWLVSGGGGKVIKFWRLVDSTPDPQQLARQVQWIRELDDDRFDVRQDAFSKLAEAGESVRAVLQDALDESASAEVRLRVNRLLAILAVPRGVGHEGDIRSLAYSADARFLASAGRDNRVVLWNINSQRPEMSLPGHSDGVWSVACSPDGRWIATGGGDHVIHLWDVSAGTLVAKLEGHESTVHQLVFSPDGSRLASAGGFDKTVKLWDVTRSRLLASYAKHRDAVLCVAFSEDGRSLAAAGYDGDIHVWQVDAPDRQRTMHVGSSVVRCLLYLPDGVGLATAGDDRIVRLWDSDSAQLIRQWTGHGDAVCAMEYWRQNRMLLTADRAGRIRSWPLVDRP